eukprot:TRINITY_DN854_c0_g1_i7.p1 TRINITY_DN854_c0_g1~~TRINITY_DN854_c0_g1_i7.p1  ORF type:complete len:358 (+),score=112.53 TRINITY_DN854_c0_g1_i7:989-2062(+)
MATLLVDPDVTGTIKKVTTDRATVVCQTIAKLYTCNGDREPWIYSNLWGVLCLVFDRGIGKICFLRLFDYATQELLFDTELYFNFKDFYYEAAPTFHYFEVSNGFIGISFTSIDEASKFKRNIQQFSPVPEPVVDAKPVKKEGGGIFDFFKSSKPEPKALEISKPKSLEMNISLRQGLTGIEVKVFNPTLKDILKNAGVKKKDLLDQETFSMIFGVLNEVLNPKPVEEAKAPTPAPPPPPAAPTGKVQINNKAPPPPPLLLPPPGGKLPLAVANPNAKAPPPPPLNLPPPPPAGGLPKPPGPPPPPSLGIPAAPSLGKLPATAPVLFFLSLLTFRNQHKLQQAVAICLHRSEQATSS